MAKTVAEIDGDSSGLVSELGQAKKAMGDLGTQGKKLSDQLKEVADQADIAAGNLVNKIGGPNAIKAIGAVTAGFTVAKQGVDMFLDSSEKLFRSYGEEGQAVWDDLEKSLNSINGTFAKAILQTDDMYVAAGRMYAALALVKDMTDSLLDVTDLLFKGMAKLPNTFVGFLAQTLGPAFEKMATEGEARARELTANMDKVGKSFEKATTPVKTLTQTIDEMEKAYAGLAGSAENVEEKQRKAALANIDNTVKQVEALALLQNMADNISGDNVGGLTDAQLEQLERLGKLREQIVAEGEKKDKPAATATGGGGGGGDEETFDEKIARLNKEATARIEAATAEREELQRLKEDNDKSERELADEALKRAVERMEEETNRKMEALQRVNDFAKQMEEEHDAEIHARGELTVAEQEERNAAILASVKDRTTQELTLYAQTATKQAVLGKLSAKEAAEMARKQLGNVIMGLGDKAMAEAGIMAAGLNPLAVPMAAAGVAAYAIGGALSADKKATGSTPATEKADSASAPVNNYSFNMRVDSVFADGESVARQFAMMQESARQRGLLQGAY